MNFKLTLGNEANEYLGEDTFLIENFITETSFKGTLYDYNNIQFVSKSGGMGQWLSDYLNFEEHEATYIAEQLNNWQNFINTTNNKE